jgi:hypothetical protein
LKSGVLRLRFSCALAPPCFFRKSSNLAPSEATFQSYPPCAVVVRPITAYLHCASSSCASASPQLGVKPTFSFAR